MNSLKLRRTQLLFILAAFIFAAAFAFRASSSIAQTSGAIFGTKTVLVIRVDFSDAAGVPLGVNAQPFTKERAENLYSEVDQFIFKNSYGKARISATVVPTLLRMPNTLAYYKQLHAQGVDLNALIEDARRAARDAGYEPDAFDYEAVAFTRTSLARGEIGVTNIGGRGMALSGAALDLRAAAHELGHSFGLEHASGFGNEYGDYLDMMGNEGTSTTHFSAENKQKLGWLTAADIQTVTATGEYTIKAQDSQSSGIRALKIDRGNGQHFWIEYRTLSPEAIGGAVFRLDNDGTFPAKTQLLDMSPATNTYDATLKIGGTPYTDPVSGIRFSTLEANGDALTVRVETGALDCTYSFSNIRNYVAGFGGIGTAGASVTTRRDCGWTPRSNDFWLTVSQPETFGHGEFSVSVAQNSGSTRVGSITIGTATFFITQGSGTCLDTIQPNAFHMAAGGETKTYSHNCGSLAVIDKPAWIEEGFYSFTASANTGGARNGTITIAVEDINGMTARTTLAVTQAGLTTVTPTPTPVITPTPTPTPVIMPTPTPEITPTPVPSPTVKSRKRVRFF